ncbi:LysR substrate-binding domain-containing protein [Embleya scabrispora]|uniref:LysR substrate-binding domain-containing protein n=1 Tax=Embleya scabrispora TaxID=159449 RepID=UPI00117D7CD7|nr:LysR substrate-binding domain-containing protein [Embleya scabrispora]
MNECLEDAVGRSYVNCGILGDLYVRSGGTSVTVTRPVVRGLLGTLLIAEETLSVECLTTAVWGPGGCSPGTLHTTVSRLREWLAEHCGDSVTVSRNERGYRLDYVRADSDLREYRRLVDGPRPSDPRERKRMLHRALDLWRGPLFANGPHGLRDDPLVVRWEASRIALALELADATVEAGDPTDPVVERLECLAKEYPYEERVYAALLHGLRLGGRRAEALRRLESVRRMLADELGIGPGVVLAEAQAELLRDSAPPPAAGSRYRTDAPADARGSVPTARDGRLVLGSFEAQLALPHVRALISGARERHPGVVVEVRHLDFVGQTAALLSGEVDVVLCYLPVAPGIRAEPLVVEPRVACVAAADPLAACSEVAFADLADRTVVSVDPRVPREWRDFWAVDPRPDGGRVVYSDDRVSNVEALFAAVSAGNGIAFLPAAGRRLYPRPGIAYVDVTGLPPCTAGVAWIPDRERDAVRAFVEGARAHVLAGDGESPGPAER